MNTVRPGPVLIGLGGTELSGLEASSLAHPAVGGVVLFTRNFSSRDQLKTLVGEIRTAAKAPMLVCVDHEGGRVQRFRAGFTRLPGLGLLGRMYRDSPAQARDFAYRHARVMATELLLVGVDLSFAPVLDLGGRSVVIGDRAFAETAEVIIDLGAHYLAGMQDAGMRTCGKHFPGHGTVVADSHTDDVLDPRSLEAIRATDMVPFRALSADLASVMMAHVVYPDVDSRPAGYSSRWVRDILRGELGFAGTVFSDDLGMHAAKVAGKLPARVDLSLAAGCDAVLICDPSQAIEYLDAADGAPPGGGEALVRLLGSNSHSESELERIAEWNHWRQSLEELEHTQWA